MSNQVTFKVLGENPNALLVDFFDQKGQPVQPQSVWSKRVLNGTVWDPGEYGSPSTAFFIGKGDLTSHPDNNFVAYAIQVDFNDTVNDGLVTIKVSQVEACNPDNNPCHVFEIVSAENVKAQLVKTGKPVSGTQLPARCDCQD